MESTTTDSGSMIAMVVIWGLFIVILYFFMIRPQSKRKKEEEAMKNNLEIGDEIVTIGGITGRVVSINEDTDTFVIETGADRTKIKLKRWALSSVETDKGNVASAKKDKKSKSNKKESDI